MRRPSRFGLTFHVERFLSRGVHTKLIALWALMLVLSLVAGGLAWLSPVTHFAGVSDAIFWAFLRLTDTGHLAEDRAPGLLVLSIVTSVLGLALFVGVLIAIMTQAFVERMDRLTLGLTPVTFDAHVAVLGWTNRTLELVAALLETPERPPRVAVLVARIDPELEQTLRERFPRRLRARLTLRSGDAEELDHLRRVLGRGPATVVLPGSDAHAVTRDTRALKIIASLDGLAGEAGAHPRLVAELADPRLLPVARAAYRGPLETIPTDHIVARSISFALLASGLSQALSEILDVRSGHSLRVERHPGLAGETVASASRRFARAVVLGAMRETDGFVALHPDPDLLVREDDSLLLLAPVGEAVAPGEPVAGEPGPPLAPEAGEAQTSRRILVLGWSEKVPDLCRELQRPRERRCSVDVLSRVEVARREAELAGCAGVRQLVGNPTSPSDLAPLDLRAYDGIVVMGSAWDGDAVEADSRTVACVLLVEHALAGSGPRPHLIAELLNTANRAVLEGRSVEVVVTPDLVAGLLAGVVSHPELGGVVGQMLLGRLGAPGVVPLERITARAETTTFGAIERAVHGDGASCLGVQREARGYALEFAPDKRERLAVGKRDRVVVVRPLASPLR